MKTLKRFLDITTFILDVDGVLTNSDILINEEGHLLRSMSIRDGFAIKTALAQQYKVFIITGGTSKGVVSRLRNLGISFVFDGVQDKITILDELFTKHDIDPQKTVYIGDDLPDYAVMRKVGAPCCPADATDEIKSISYYMSPKNGGRGCVRDIIEKVMKLQGTWPSYEPV